MELDKIMDDYPFYNIFAERLGLKSLYLNAAYGVDIDLFNILINLTSQVALDKRLEELFFKDDATFNYVREAFKEHKINNGTTLATIMKHMSTLDLTPLAEELKGQIGELNKLADKKN